MIPFDKKAIEICKENKYAFFKHYNRITYGEYVNQSYISKSLPGLTIANDEELNLIINLIGRECIRIINSHYIEFFDPKVIQYNEVSAPLCFLYNGHFSYNNRRYTGKVPSPEMLEAAEILYGIIKMCITPKLSKLREDRLYLEFFKNTLDGHSAIINTYLSADKISKDFIVIIKKRANNCNTFFIVKKSSVYTYPKLKYIEFTISEKYFSFVSNRKDYLSKRLKMDVYLKMSRK